MYTKSILDWVTTKDFEDAVPLNMLHKEQDQTAVKIIEEQRSSLCNMHILFRASVSLQPKTEKVAFKISGDDYYKLYINGHYVSQGPAPSYPQNYYYNVPDIEKYLVEGENSIAVHLYYQGLINRVWNSGDNRCALGTCLTVNEKDVPLKWYYKVTEAFKGGTTGYETQFLEDFDSRKWDENWKTFADFSNAYDEAVPAKWADYRLSEQPTRPLDVYEVTPTHIYESDSNGKCRLFADFGREITGSLILRAEGRGGSVVTIRSGEELNNEALTSVKYEMRCNCTYEEKWTLREGGCTYENYDYKGFRYVELLFDETVEIKSVKALMRHYPFDEAYCKYEGHDEKLKAIFDLCKYTVKLGTQENYVDCPTREKSQYLGDAIITARAQAHLTGKTDMLRKCIDQFAQTSEVCEGLLAVAPGSFMQEIGDFSLLWSELLLTDYFFTKDKDFLRKFIPVAEGILGHFSQYENEDGLLDCVADKWNLVDWPENLRDGYDFALTRPVVGKGCHNVINALYIGAMGNLIKLRKLAGVEGDFEEAAKLKEKTDLFNEYFLDSKTGLYRDSITSGHSSLHSNAYPLYFGIVPDANVDRICGFIEDKGLNCGVFLSYFVLKGLTQSGKGNIAYKLLTNEGEHGWMNMLREGATSAYEAWGREQKWNTSLCHPWACGPISIILEDFDGSK